MTSRERIETTLQHQQPDVLPVDFGGGFQTGIHVSMVYKLRQALGLDAPGTPVRVVEIYQMLGEIAPDLKEAIGIDTACLSGTGTMFGFSAKTFKEWALHDGTPVLVPTAFNTEPEPNGDLLQYPGGDRSVPASGRMPAGGHFFDATDRAKPVDDDYLDTADNGEEFTAIEDDELAHYAEKARQLATSTDKALFCTFGGLTFGDVALVPATFLKDPKGIRDVEEWYISTMTRPDYIKAVFERQAEIAVQNLARLYEVVGDRITVIQTNGTDFGTQNGPFCSPNMYRELYLPYQQKVNGWIHDHTPWKTFIHSCGGIDPLLPLIIEAGFDILNPVQTSCKGLDDTAALKAQWGDRLAFHGAMDVQQMMPNATRDELRWEIAHRMTDLGHDGGYIIAPCHNIGHDIPVETTLAFFEMVRELGRYPLDHADILATNKSYFARVGATK